MPAKSKIVRGITSAEVRKKFVAVILLTVFSLIVVLPGYVNSGISWVNAKTNVGVPTLPDKGFNLGLDLQGGAHLIYQAKIDMIPAEDRANAVEGVRDVIERRVRGGLGVAEPLVQTTRVGNDYRIIVELPGINNIDQAIALIGETPILEFKERNTDPDRDLTPAEQKEMEAFNKAGAKKAAEALTALRRGTTFDEAVNKFSEDEKTKASHGEMGFITKEAFPAVYAWAEKHKDGEASKEITKSPDSLSIVKRLGERPGEKTVTAAHILICHKEVEGCPTGLSEEEAKAKIEELKKQATVKNFAELAKQNSVEPGAEKSGGDLPVLKTKMVVPAFEEAIWNIPSGSIVGPVKTPFGYHLIYKKGEEILKEFRVARIYFKQKQKEDYIPAREEWKATGLSGKQLKRAEVGQNSQTGEVEVSLKFNDEGAKLFGEITTRNVGKQIAIFLDKELVGDEASYVRTPITAGEAIMTGGYTIPQARSIAQRLNSGALPVGVELISQKTVGATLGQESLKQSFTAGIYALLAVMLFMIAYYRLPGLLAVGSLLFYAVLNLALFKTIGVTLTLSGIAGFILSIGMAVDANILVFERLKEELQQNKMLKTATEESFVRAWPSIRDSHITALISCVFLMWFGSGFIQGFAVVLLFGTLINLFTAITVTRTIMRLVFAKLPDKGNALILGYKK